MILLLQNENLTLRVDTFGAQMMELSSCKGTQYLWNGDPKYWSSRAPILFPFVGRLFGSTYRIYGERYQMDLHGFAKKSEFTVEAQTDHSVTLRLTSNPETLREYPFHFDFRVRYELRGWRVVTSFAVHNFDEKELPFALGGHPGFRVPLAEGTQFEDYMLRFSHACQPDRIGFTDQVLLSGTDTRFPLENDTTLRLSHALFDQDAIFLKNMARYVTLCSEKTHRAVTLTYPQMPYLGLWHMPKTDAPYICIEPWSSLPARQDVEEELSCKSDLIHLATGAEYRNTWSITITED